MDDPVTLVETVKNYGLAAMVVMETIAIAWMARYIVRLHSEQRESDKAASEAQREDIKTTVTAIVETRDALRAFKEAMVALTDKIKEWK